MPCRYPQTSAQAASMRLLVRQWFQHALEQASVEKAFARHVECERGVLRVGEDLYHLNSYSRRVRSIHWQGRT